MTTSTKRILIGIGMACGLILLATITGWLAYILVPRPYSYLVSMIAGIVEGIIIGELYTKFRLKQRE